MRGALPDGRASDTILASFTRGKNGWLGCLETNCAVSSHLSIVDVGELLTVKGVTKRFKKRCVLSDVSFSVHRGEVLGLIGPNGAGKTTLFECLAGLMTADAGTLRLGDKILPPAHRKEALFYLPDAILPWAEQSVSWALHFFEKLYRPSKTTVSNLIQPAEPVSGKVGVWSKTDSVSYFDDLHGDEINVWGPFFSPLHLGEEPGRGCEA